MLTDRLSHFCPLYRDGRRHFHDPGRFYLPANPVQYDGQRGGQKRGCLLELEYGFGQRVCRVQLLQSGEPFLLAEPAFPRRGFPVSYRPAPDFKMRCSGADVVRLPAAVRQKQELCRHRRPFICVFRIPVHESAVQSLPRRGGLIPAAALHAGRDDGEPAGGLVCAGRGTQRAGQLCLVYR